MTKGEIPNYATLKARFIATAFLHSHPLPDTRRNALFAALIDHMNVDRACWPGTRRLSAITRISRPLVLKLLNEFDEHGLTSYLDPPQTGKKPRRLRLNYECVAGYVVVNHALPLEGNEMVNPELTTSDT